MQAIAFERLGGRGETVLLATRIVGVPTGLLDRIWTLIRSVFHGKGMIPTCIARVTRKLSGLSTQRNIATIHSSEEPDNGEV